MMAGASLNGRSKRRGELKFSASDLLLGAHLMPAGEVTWGERVASRTAGVYVIETPESLSTAPLDRSAIAAWMARSPSILVDGEPASVAVLAERLGSFWIPNERVVYVGLAGTSVARRVDQFYRTPLGDPRPHAGGHWLKALASLARLRVWWAESDDPDGAEAALLDAFASRHGGGLVLPFANRQTATGARKPHGISRSTASSPNERPAVERRTSMPGEFVRAGSRLEGINAALQRLACGDPAGEVSAVDAARELDRLGLLKDSRQRPGLPLRKLLRDDRIESAWQKDGRWWFIRCGRS
jgi:hypothetical protein